MSDEPSSSAAPPAPPAAAVAPINAPSKPKAKASKGAGAPSTQLPLGRVHRIIKADRDVRLCSKEAIFLIAKATEFMIAKMVNQAHAHGRMEGRPKFVKYQDLGSSTCLVFVLNKTPIHTPIEAAVAARPEWFYIAEVIPPTIPLHQALAINAALKNGFLDEDINANGGLSSAAANGGGQYMDGNVPQFKKGRKVKKVESENLGGAGDEEAEQIGVDPDDGGFEVQSTSRRGDDQDHEEEDEDAEMAENDRAGPAP